MPKISISFQRVEEELKKQGLTRADLARMISVTPQQIYAWSRRGVSKNGVQKIADALNISVPELWLADDSLSNRPSRVQIIDFYGLKEDPLDGSGISEKELSAVRALAGSSAIVHRCTDLDSDHAGSLLIVELVEEQDELCPGSIVLVRESDTLSVCVFRVRAVITGDIALHRSPGEKGFWMNKKHQKLIGKVLWSITKHL